MRSADARAARLERLKEHPRPGLIKSGMKERGRMIPGSEGSTTAGPAQDSSDAIELELTGEQGPALSRAAARPDESGPVLSVPEYENFASARTARIDFAANVIFAVAAVLGIAVVFLWPASDRHPHTPAVTSAARLAVVTPA